jgi:hypothetical protein
LLSQCRMLREKRARVGTGPDFLYPMRSDGILPLLCSFQQLLPGVGGSSMGRVTLERMRVIPRQHLPGGPHWTAVEHGVVEAGLRVEGQHERAPPSAGQDAAAANKLCHFLPSRAAFSARSQRLFTHSPAQKFIPLFPSFFSGVKFVCRCLKFVCTHLEVN